MRTGKNWRTMLTLEENTDSLIDYLFHLPVHGSEWMNQGIMKWPVDLLMIQEALVRSRTEVVVELGSCSGSSAIFFETILTMMESLGIIPTHKVITVEVVQGRVGYFHPTISYITGSSTDPETLRQVMSLIPPGARVSVDLDSDHEYEHVLKEMKLYADIVTQGCYLIVEDTVLGGPLVAVHEFLTQRKDFSIDVERDRWLLSLNTNGYLRSQP